MSTANRNLDYATDYTEVFRLDSRRSILVIIDMQYASASRSEGLGKRLSAEGRETLATERFDRIEQVVLPNLQRLQTFFRGHGLPVMYLTIGSDRADYLDMAEHVRAIAVAAGNRVGQRAHEILDELKPLEHELVLRKTTISGFKSTGLDGILRSLGVDHLIFAGVSTNQCVDATARDAAELGFKCVIVEDCCAAARQSYHEASLLNFRRFYGRVVMSQDAMKELR